MKNPLKSFRPASLDFDIKWLKKWQKENCEFRSFRITTSIVDNEPVRTYGIIGFPKQMGPLPGILHIHGGGQTASPENVFYHVKRGYVTMTFDWTGSREERNPEKTTTYPKSIIDIPPDYFTELEVSGLEKTHVFMASKAARCCLAFLSSFDEVDSDKIGFYGISWGGFISWLVNGTDKTQKCAVPIYGTGGIHWPGHIQNQIWSKLSDKTRNLWSNVLEPSSYANCQNSPVLHINPTDDFFGGFNVAAQLLPALNVNWLCDYTPNGNHTFDFHSGKLIEQWFDFHLKKNGKLPVAPDVSVNILDEETLEIKTKGNPQNQTLWYSCGNVNHYARCWLSSDDWEEDGDKLSMKLPVCGETWLYVRKYDPETKVKVSSIPLRISQPDRKIKRKKVLYDKNFKLGGWAQSKGTEIFSDSEDAPRLVFDKNCLKIKTPDNKFNGLMTHGPSNPLSPPPKNCQGIEVEIKGAKKIGLQCVPYNILERSNNYTCKLKKAVDGKNSFSLKEFKNDKQKKLESFSQISSIVLRGEIRKKEELRIYSVKWI